MIVLSYMASVNAHYTYIIADIIRRSYYNVKNYMFTGVFENDSKIDSGL